MSNFVIVALISLSYEFSPFIVVFSLISLRQNENGTYFSLLDVH
jgi:hypothetical protein